MQIIKLRITGSSIFCVLFALCIIPSESFAWNKHQTLMASILSNPSESLKKILSRTAEAPCAEEDKKRVEAFISQLLLNPKTQVPPTAPQKCGPGTSLSVYEVLIGGSIDDPDLGMDRDLPTDSKLNYDPQQDRKWMGGTQGPTSQGFRHMYAGGWKVSHPITTFQVPPRALGQAPHRADLIAHHAKELIRAGSLVWGTRLLGWAMHYLQDLTQPFHSVQIMHLRMVPWYALLTWPPTAAFEQLVIETTRVITNYHWAYEAYTLNRILAADEGPYVKCLRQPENYSELKFDPKTQTPWDLAIAITQASIQVAPSVASAELDFLGTDLRKPGVDFTKNPEMIPMTQYASRADLSSQRSNLEGATCQALANASKASHFLIEWAFQP